MLCYKKMEVYLRFSTVRSVTDKGTKMCVDPGGSGAILSAGERGGPGLPGGGGNR
jgi:hypothetical protein